MTIKEFQNKFGIIGKSKEIHDLVDIAMQVSKSDISILLYGESGTGKEVFARALHGFSNRAGGRLVSVNCGAIPEGILESELFGHKKGSFTGASEDRKGLFEMADGGTLFLDEIAEMPLSTQVKLLRALETKEFMRIGSETVTRVDVRIIAATNKDLQREVDAKKFRKDLYFRLKAVSLNIPPLRQRKEDIGLLANAFIEEYRNRNHTNGIELTNDAYEILRSYHWPGNVRELKNTVETAIALNTTGLITSESIRPLLDTEKSFSEPANLPVHVNRSPDEIDREMIYRALIEIKKDLLDLKRLTNEHNSVAVEDNDSIEIKEVMPLHALEKKAIENALEYTRWNKREAAELLKISQSTLFRKIKEYGL